MIRLFTLNLELGTLNFMITLCIKLYDPFGIS